MSSMSWQDLSEIAAGAILSGEYSRDAFDADSFIQPYDKLVRELGKPRSGKLLESDRIIELVGFSAYEAAKAAWGRARKLQQSWPELLERASARHDAGRKFVKFGERLLAGEEVDVPAIINATTKLDQDVRTMAKLSSITPETNPHILTGWHPIDHHLGGVPRRGMIVVGAPPGTGKTSLLAKIAGVYAGRKKTFGFFSLELQAADFFNRFLEINGKPGVKLADYVRICDERLSVGEIGSLSARVADLDAVGIDFADLLVEDEASEATYGKIYKSIAWLAKLREIPVFLVSQLSRGYSEGRLPVLTDLRYSGMAEALSGQVWLLHNPSRVFIKESENVRLNLGNDEAALIVAKSRYGFRGRVPHKTTGAIVMDWKGEVGWGDIAKRWIDLPSG